MNPFTISRPNNYREWSYDNFATISEYCKNQYSINTVILIKTSKEKASKIKKYFNESSHVINLINQTSLGEMLCVLNQSEFYIGPDSGTLHGKNG